MGKRLAILFVTIVISCSGGQSFDLEKIITRRPARDALIFDYVGVMKNVSESTGTHLNTIRDTYGIEIVIAVVPTVGRYRTIEQAAAALFSNWDIGRGYEGRGLLILLADDTRRVKIEVGFELEDVFTDAFTGHIQDLQLQPRYASGQLDIGIIAVMEELENRSAIKFGGDYSHAAITRMDSKFLSQGAGAGHSLTEGDTVPSQAAHLNPNYPAGATPAEAWNTMIERWRNKERDPFLGVFTPLTRLTYRDFTGLPDARYIEDYRTYFQKGYEVLQNQGYAVIYFGKKTGWDNAPFLFCRTPQGWQFDIVHQRRFIRMGRAPHWGVEFSEHPYMGLLADSFHFNGQDIPLEGEDLYTVDRDAELAEAILACEKAAASDNADVESMISLGRLYTMVSMSRKGMRLLEKARTLKPDDPRPYKYLAIAHVNAHYQYDAALSMMEAYIRREPLDPFGHNYIGYLYYCKKMYNQAAQIFEKALTLQHDTCYAHYYLCRIYAHLYTDTSQRNPRRTHYKDRFDYHVAQTRSFEKSHPLRILWLNRWLNRS